MTKAEQKQKVLGFIKNGEDIKKKEYHTGGSGLAIPYISGPLYEAWMSEIKIFNDRHLKDHPLHSEISDTVFHHKGQLSSYKNMMGHLQALERDDEYWQEDHKVSLPVVQTLAGAQDNEVTKSPVVFMSHRSTDADVAAMIRDCLVSAGILNEHIFCSSLPGVDVKQAISREVKQKLTNSVINIVILSRDYYDSAYCLNEAGIIWMKEPEVPAIVVALPEIDHTNMLGFLNSEYKIRRLNNVNDIAFIYDSVRNAVGATQVSLSAVMAAAQSLIETYHEHIANRIAKKPDSGDNQRSDGKSVETRLLTPLEHVSELLQNPDEWVDEDSRYYHSMFPQYTIAFEYEEDEYGISQEGNREFYHYLQMKSSTQYGMLKIYHNTTQLYSCSVTELDGHRMTAPCPEWGCISYRNYGDADITFKYYVKSGLKYILLRFLEHKIGECNGHDAQIATRRLLEVVLLFDSKNDVEDFKVYVNRHLGRFEELAEQQKAPHISDPSELVVEVETKRIRDSYALKIMQKKWEEHRLENA